MKDLLALMLNNDPCLPLDYYLDIGFSKENVLKTFFSLAQNLRLKSIFPYEKRYGLGSYLSNYFQSNSSYYNRLVFGHFVSPQIIEVHLSRMCQLKCNICLWRDPKSSYYTENEKLLTYSDWVRLFKQIENSDVIKIVFSGGGEPIYDKEYFFSILDYLVKNNKQEIDLYTNGLALKDLSTGELALLDNLNQIRFNLNGYNASSYQFMHGKDCFDQVIVNIANLLRGLKTTDIGIGYTITEDNNDIFQIFHFISSLKIGFLDINHNYYKHPSEIFVNKPLNRNQLLNTYLASKGMLKDWPRLEFSDELLNELLLQDDNSEYDFYQRCYGFLRKVTINSSGQIFPCPSLAQPRFDSKIDKWFCNIRDIDITKYFSVKRMVMKCKNCLPSCNRINLVMNKFISDHKNGIDLKEQLFSILHNNAL